jgi:Mg2+/Co2+ transporter CorB
LVALIVVLVVLSAFFSGTETALMSLNRYRLRHQARGGHRGARVAEWLLQRPDRLIGLILLGNTSVNLGAAALTTVVALRVGGEGAILAGTLILTVVVLIFGEVAPKTIAALHPARIALPAALIYYPLLKIAYPAVGYQHHPTAVRLVGVRPIRLPALTERRGAAHRRPRRRNGAALTSECCSTSSINDHGR